MLMKKVLLRVLVSLSFLVLLFYLMREDIPLIVQTLKNVHRGLFYASALVFLATVPLLSQRLHLMFGVTNTRVRLTTCLNLTFIGYFFNNFLPTSVGGDVVKAMCASRITGKPVTSVTVVLMDRLFGLFTFVLIPSISLLFFMKQIQNRSVPVVVYSFLAVSIFCFFLLFSRRMARRFGFLRHAFSFFRLGDRAGKIYDGLHNFKHHKTVILYAMLLSVAGQSLAILVLYGMALALGAYTQIIYFFLLVPIVHLVSMLPSLNGLGIREGAYIYFLTPYIGKEHAAAIGVVWLGLLFLLSLIGGIIYLVRHDYHIQWKPALTAVEGAVG